MIPTIRNFSVFFSFFVTCSLSCWAFAVDEDWASTYAEKATRQIQTSLRLDCGFSGPRWNPNEEDHRVWALEHSEEEVESESNGRTEDLQACMDEM